ncbi:hypothetical protein Tco_0864765, partial [Tanacetum coccineum]
IVETDKVIHTVEADMVKLVVEIESFGMNFDEFDKETGSSDGLQPKQADLSCVVPRGRVFSKKVIHTVETDILKLVVEIEIFGMSFDEFDMESRSSDGLQPKQMDLNCVHTLNELHLHETRVVLSRHEANQY